MSFFNELTYVIPVHNEEETIQKTVTKILSHFPDQKVKIILVENGSRDSSRQVCIDCQTKMPSRVTALSIVDRGLGYALFHGFNYYLRQINSQSSERCFAVFVGAEIPFGFTDLDQIEKLHDQSQDAPIYIGSKGLDESILTVSFSRKYMSFFFYLIRRILLGLTVKDPQGTLFIDHKVLAQILPRAKLRDFFFTTELIFLAHRAGFKMIEVPIVMNAPVRKSTVRPLRDSLRALKAIFNLRFRR